MSVLGVGIIGAGAATQAIHLPSIAALGGRVRVVHVMDPDESVGAAVAARVSATFSTNVQSLVEDKSVDIVAICSPDSVHADQVEAACRAGKKAVFCEKPLAKSQRDAERISLASNTSGVPVVVGTMHRYDPAFVAAMAEWEPASSGRLVIRSSIYLPDNSEMTGLATNQAGHTITPGAAPVDLSQLPARADALRNGILGLAIHNLPLVRLFAPGLCEVTEARWVEPYGYAVTIEEGQRVARMTALMPGVWAPSWTFEVFDDARHLRISFPPSYVLAGSSSATITGPRVTRSWQFDESGYERQWRHVADLADGLVQPEVSVDEVVADLAFAMSIADRAAQRLLERAA